MIVYCAAAACAVAVVLLASRLLRRTRRATDDPAPDGPTASHAGAMLSALFLLAFAIAIVVPWTSADSARSNTYAESQAIAEAAWAAERLPPQDARRVRHGLREYVDLVRGPEWRLMENGRLSPLGWAELDGVRRAAIAVEAGDDEELKDAREAVLAQVGEISAARRQRAMDARTTPPGGLLAVTVTTGAVVVLLPFLAGARPRGMTLVPLSLMAALLAAGTYLTIDISQVFGGALAVGPEAFAGLPAELRRIAEGG